MTHSAELIEERDRKRRMDGQSALAFKGTSKEEDCEKIARFIVGVKQLQVQGRALVDALGSNFSSEFKKSADDFYSELESLASWVESDADFCTLRLRGEE